MNIFIRTFNPEIVAKTGRQLPAGKHRDGSCWRLFEEQMIECIKALGFDVIEQPESPMVPDQDCQATCKIYVHKTRREIPDGNYFYMQMHMKELFVLDKNGWGADHSSQITADDVSTIDLTRATDFSSSLKQEVISSGESKHPQAGFGFVDRFFSSAPIDYILAPLQVPRDTVIKHHSPVSVIEYINLLSQWARKEKRHVMFKLHPHNKKDYGLQLSLLKQVLFNPYVHVQQGNIHELIANAQAVVIINSGTGFEALILGKPVATFGDCDYKVASFNLDKNLTGLSEYLSNYGDKERTFTAQFLYYYFNHHAYYLAPAYLQASKQRLKNYFSERLKRHDDRTS